MLTAPDDSAVSLQICREQFVALHNEPILQTLADDLAEKFGEIWYVTCKLLICCNITSCLNIISQIRYFHCCSLQNDSASIKRCKMFYNALLQRVPSKGESPSLRLRVSR